MAQGPSATAPISAGTRVDDSPVHACELDAFARLGIEVESHDGSARDRSPNVPVSTGRHHAQGPHRVRSDDVRNSSRGERPRGDCGARRRAWGPSIRPPIVRPLVASLLFVRGPAALPVGAGVLLIVISPGETIVIAAIVFSRTGEGRCRGERQNKGARGDGDRGLQGLLLLVLLGQRASGVQRTARWACGIRGPLAAISCAAQSRATAPFPARSPCPCTGSSASPRPPRRQWMQDGHRERRGSPASRSCIPCRPNIAGMHLAVRAPTDPP
jgi:hypothetical protein